MGDPVAPITFPEVVANARGICVVTTDQALQLQQADYHLSVDALAVVSIGEIPLVEGRQSEDMHWPAVYAPTNKEPIIVKGTLLQLGDVEVSQAPVIDAPQVATLDTEVIRMSVFRDGFAKDWSQLVKGPVRYLLSLIPALQRCPDSECPGQCRFFHAACDEEVSHPVLDVWSWRWTSMNNRVVPVDQAEVSSAFIRVPASALMSILSWNGWNGVFLEPRPANKQGSHPLFTVIWFPKGY